MTGASNNRREFLSMATAAAAATAMPSLAAATTNTVKGETGMASTNRAAEIFKPEFRFDWAACPSATSSTR